MNALEIREEPLATRKILVTIDDITERKRVSEALEAAKRMAEQANLGKSRFLAAASHDLRQPLQSLTLLASALKPNLHNAAGHLLVARIERSLGLMKDVLDSLLDINRLETGVLAPIEAFGAQITLDTCILASPMLPPEIKTLMTNSAKYAYYAPSLLNTRVTFGSLADCVRSAIEGRVVRDESLWQSA